MRIAITGASGFIGRYIVQRMLSAGHICQCWHRGPTTPAFELKDSSSDRLQWIPGQLADTDSAQRLVAGCQAIIHSALDRPGAGFRGAEGDVANFVDTNVLGTIRLIETAKSAGVPRFIFISTCAVHEVILDDRPLDEAHPLWPKTHYGAHKAAIEKFIHSYGFGHSYDICALRPSGVYGVATPAQHSKWYALIAAVVRGETVQCSRGGKEVHAADVAQACEILLTAPDTAGQAYSCCDRYVSEIAVAELAKEISGSQAEIVGQPISPKHQIVTDKLQSLGMQFGGDALLRATVRELVAFC